MWRIVALLAAGIVVVIVGISLVAGGSGEVRASAIFSSVDTSISGYARAIAPHTWDFPQDFGPHPDFQTEWWYYTGNLADENGRRFGFQFTIFRRAITPIVYESDSEWRTNQIYMAHFTVTDVTGDQFYHQQRFSRGAAGLAGATTDPRYHVWLDDWQIQAQDDSARSVSIMAATDEVAIDLQLEQIKPPALQGDHGLSQKGDEPGNASYYYSLTRLLTEGTITIGDTVYTVSGTTWKDHEFSTSALGDTAQGWDWFGLQLDDDRELMLGQIRLVDGGREPAFGGLLVYPDGSTRTLDSSDFTFTVTGRWQSPHTGATYPAGWQIGINIGETEPLNLTLTPLISDQELTDTGNVDYWEGAVRITGDATGYGYAELTGYVNAMTGRF
ncbi:MAG: carotenoid 1,2-hydratase [Anaerolineaceae bacterium]|nr:carotenoid 1,2-hydratase [Anaerolineaceae bacterium]